MIVAKQNAEHVDHRKTKRIEAAANAGFMSGAKDGVDSCSGEFFCVTAQKGGRQNAKMFLAGRIELMADSPAGRGPENRREWPDSKPCMRFRINAAAGNRAPDS